MANACKDYDRLVGYAQLTYNSELTSVTVDVVATHRDGAALAYDFNGSAALGGRNATSTATYIKGKDSGPIFIAVTAADGARLELEPVDLHWDAPEVC